jgi:hypothetical protein
MVAAVETLLHVALNLGNNDENNVKSSSTDDLLARSIDSSDYDQHYKFPENDDVAAALENSNNHRLPLHLLNANSNAHLSSLSSQQQPPPQQSPILLSSASDDDDDDNDSDVAYKDNNKTVAAAAQ